MASAVAEFFVFLGKKPGNLFPVYTVTRTVRRAKKP
jgi:hypothetical protein